MLLSKVVKARNCIAERPGTANVFPSQSGKAGCDSEVSSCKSPSLPTQRVLTAKRSDRRVHRLDKNAFPIDLRSPVNFPVSSSLLNSRQSWNHHEPYLVTSLAVEQDPTQFDDFCRVFCDIHTMLVAGGRNMDDDISVEFGDWCSRGCHAGWTRRLGTIGSGELEVRADVHTIVGQIIVLLR